MFSLNSAHTTKQLEKSISYRAVKVWNEIPVEYKNLKTTASLKNKWQGSLVDKFMTEH